MIQYGFNPLSSANYYVVRDLAQGSRAAKQSTTQPKSHR